LQGFAAQLDPGMHRNLQNAMLQFLDARFASLLVSGDDRRGHAAKGYVDPVRNPVRRRWSDLSQDLIDVLSRRLLGLAPVEPDQDLLRACHAHVVHAFSVPSIPPAGQGPRA